MMEHGGVVKSSNGPYCLFRNFMGKNMTMCINDPILLQDLSLFFLVKLDGS